MSGGGDGSRPPYGIVDAPVACPYCGNALREGVAHLCRELLEAQFGDQPPGLISNRDAAFTALFVVACFEFLCIIYLLVTR